MSKIIFYKCVLPLLALLLSACSTAAPKVSERFFFPRPPNEPKIEYIKTYLSNNDVKPDNVSLMTTFVLGEEYPHRLFSSPVSVASTGKGRVFVTDVGLRKVIVLDLINFEQRELTHKSSENALEQGFRMPYSVFVDDNERIYVSDILTQKVSVFDAQERFLFSLSDSGIARPVAVAVDELNQRIYVLDTSKHRLAIFDMRGVFLNYLGSPGFEPGQFNYPTDVDVDDQGHVYVLDTLNARVQVFDENGAFLRMFGERGTAQGSFMMAKGLAVRDRGEVYVTDALASKLVIFSREGEFLLRIGNKSVVEENIFPGGFYMPRGVDVDGAGGLWVVDSLNQMVHQFQFLTTQYLSDHPLDQKSPLAQ